MTHLGQLVSDGVAEWPVLEDDEVELRFVSGEVSSHNASNEEHVNGHGERMA
jgi:hypothetical protein